MERLIRHIRSVKHSLTRKTMREETTNMMGAAGMYAPMLGKKVLIFYRDTRGTDRKMIGTITSIDGDLLWLENNDTWKGCINCANAKISIISAIDGWGTQQLETKEIY